jgi:RNA polymerase sigma factor (sigma-70 family)
MRGSPSRSVPERAAAATRSPEVPDEALVVASRRGDLRAWERLTRRYQEPAFRAAYLITRSMPTAEAATQAAFLRAYRALPALEEGAPVRPWLIRVVASEARMQRREDARLRNTSRTDMPLASPRLPASRFQGGGEMSGLTTQEREALLTAFERLAEDDRLTIASRYLFALSPQEASAALGVPPESVEDRLRGALGLLRARLGEA